MAGDNKDQPTGGNDLVALGDHPNGGTTVSMQVLQAVYSELTGKTEEMSRNYEKNFLVSFEDFVQLNHRLSQVHEQYNIKQQTCSVTVYHEDDRKESFTSFDRFKIYNQAYLKPTHSIVITYNFLIVLPKVNKAKNYELSIQLASGVVIFEKLKKDLPRPLWDYVSKRTATISLKYVDYLVARNLMDTVDEWIKGLNETTTPVTIKYLRKSSKIIPSFLKYSLFLLSIYLTVEVLPRYVSSVEINLISFGQYMIIAYAVLFVAYRVGLFFGNKFEDSIRGYFDISYVKLNRGDEQRIENFLKSNKLNAIKAIASAMGAIAYGIISTAIGHWLKLS